AGGSGCSTEVPREQVEPEGTDNGALPERELSLTGTTALPARPKALVGRAERQPRAEPDAIRWLAHECNLPAGAAEQVVRYVRAERDGIGLVPTQQDVVFERLFDESGRIQLVVHAPFGARWRWNATRALAILRQRQGKKVPPQIQRMRADDLMAAVFPKLVGCQENQTGPIEIPDHPIVRQTVYDCMHEAMDIDGLKDVLDRIDAGEIRLHANDTTEPSPFAHDIPNSNPATYLHAAPHQ